jgi:plastocyanin
MKIHHGAALLAPLVLAGILTAVAPAAPSTSKASLVIRHQEHGCHAWSLNGGPYGVQQTVAIRRGGSVRVTNNDVMPHKLVETSGPAVVYTRLAAGMSGTMGLKGTFAPSMLARMGSSSTITFTKSGLYHFTTKPGEDYMAGIKTVGEDNVLRLTVRVA